MVGAGSGAVYGILISPISRTRHDLRLIDLRLSERGVDVHVNMHDVIVHIVFHSVLTKCPPID